MKKWQKGTIGIIGVIIVAVAIAVAVMWSSINILKGTQEISGDTGKIPEVTSRELKPVIKGENDWISWSGATGDSRNSVIDILKDWSNGLTKRWEVNYLCQGNESATWSAPVIQGNRLIVCGRDTDKDLVFCLDPKDGTLLWQAAYHAQAKSNHGSGPRATPFIDDDRVYTFGRSGELACWNLCDGTEIWRKNVTNEGGEPPTWGYASSPLLWQNYIIVQGGGTARTIAFDKMTGEIAWKSGNGIPGYAAIVTTKIDSSPALIVFHGKGLAALDAVNGEQLWNVFWETSYDVNASTPVVTGNKVFITSGYGVGCELLKVSRTNAEVIWQNTAIAAIHSDPYIIDGHIYGYSGDSHQNRGKFKCISLETGEEKWSTNDMGWGTCMFLDGHLLCCDIKGNIYLMKPDPHKFIEVTRLRKALGDINGPVWTRPVIANRLLYLRFKQHLVCYELVQQ